MTYAQQNAKLVLVGKSNTLLLDSSLVKCVDTMFDDTPIEVTKLYKIITADLTFYISVFFSQSDVKTVWINDIDIQLIAEFSKNDKQLFFNNEPIDLMYLPFILLILEKL